MKTFAKIIKESNNTIENIAAIAAIVLSANELIHNDQRVLIIISILVIVIVALHLTASIALRPRRSRKSHRVEERTTTEDESVFDYTASTRD